MAAGCKQCKSDQKSGFDFAFAYQPIVELSTRSIYAHEALVRGPNGESAYSVLSQVTEGEQIVDWPHLVKFFREYRRFGFRTAIDDFGAEYAGLNILSEYQHDIIKIDMDMVRDIDTSLPIQAIFKGIVSICAALKVRVLAEGIETAAERDFLRSTGIDLMQSYLFCKPAFQALGTIESSAWA